MWIHAIEAAKQYKLPSGAVFHIVAAYHRPDDSPKRPAHNGRLATALQLGNHQEIHDLLRELDEEYGTQRKSPLHHDNRCPLHRRR